VRMAAQLDRAHLPKETTSSMRQQLSQGEPVEVGGYSIHPELASAVDAARLADRALPASTHVLWIENAGPNGDGLAPASQKITSQWTQQGIRLDIATTDGPAFWQLHERVTSSSVLESTTSWFAQNALGR
jgi:hypothetical protein